MEHPKIQRGGDSKSRAQSQVTRRESGAHAHMRQDGPYASEAAFRPPFSQLMVIHLHEQQVDQEGDDEGHRGNEEVLPRKGGHEALHDDRQLRHDEQVAGLEEIERVADIGKNMMIMGSG